jgi:hypothetical protein
VYKREREENNDREKRAEKSHRIIVYQMKKVINGFSQFRFGEMKIFFFAHQRLEIIGGY